ncbi:MAG TPA: GDP-mannose 4,6-dehydratase [Desulfitobacteriaceae bacterium]|nr:GDP-mannose 4,6-dehydratase [Desulfitobacteriaceae bacterium]
MKSILVTGGAGFIGSHVCEALLNRDYQVISIDSFNDFYDPRRKRRNIEEIKAVAASRRAENSFISVEGDIRDRGCLEKLFATYKPEAVIHLAAYAGVRPSIQNPVLYTDVNISGTVNLLECLKDHRVRYHVFASSSSVYGNNKKVPFSENDIVDFPISPYAATKKSGELLCHTYHHLYGINTACLRFFTVYGPRQRPDLAIHKFAGLMTQGLPVPLYGDGSTQRDYTFIADIIDGVVKSLEWTFSADKKYEVFNLGESQTISLAQMVATLEKVTGLKAVLDHQPRQPGDVDCTYADISKAKAMLGYNPVTSFEAGVAAFVSWYKKNNAIF